MVKHSHRKLIKPNFVLYKEQKFEKPFSQTDPKKIKEARIMKNDNVRGYIIIDFMNYKRII